ncbi:MAG TPA: hypothetical protein ENI87_03720, partial [bacterium]|nr:hypothetical protein [bacterium]
MTRCCVAFPATGLWLLVTACATPPTPLPDAALLVSAAEEQVKAAKWDDVLATLAPLADDACPRQLRDRRDIALARAQLGNGEPWDAYLTLRDFSDDYPHSSRRGEVTAILWQAGKQLAESDGGFLFLWSDRDAGRTVLEHLITRHPDTRRLADALRILGDMAFADGDYQLAQARYRTIILDRPDSDWRFYAQFRFAMSIAADLQGPDYDLAQMVL